MQRRYNDERQMQHATEVIKDLICSFQETRLLERLVRQT